MPRKCDADDGDMVLVIGVAIQERRHATNQKEEVG